LDYKRLGPFKVIKQISNTAYKLALPKTYQIHPVIHIARIEKVKPDKYNHPQPKVTLKVQDPKTGEIINQQVLPPKF
jgi:hypothetical protein